MRGSSIMTPAISMTMLGKWAIIGLTPQLAALASPKRKPRIAPDCQSSAFARQTAFAEAALLDGGSSWRKKTEDWHAEAGRCAGSLITDFPEARHVRLTLAHAREVL
jgi:hypothetical protein